LNTGSNNDEADSREKRKKVVLALITHHVLTTHWDKFRTDQKSSTKQRTDMGDNVIRHED
jgi:hypothetical protein